MAEAKNFHSYSGTKLSFDKTGKGSGPFTQVKGLKTIPDIGSEPEDIESTTMDNVKYKTAIPGLEEIQKYPFEFNMEDPAAEANIKLVSDLEDAGTVCSWKLEYSNGITVSFNSPVRTMIKGGQYGDIIGFTMTLYPIDEPVVDLGIV